ncbi:MAG: excinuclease ABC subunit UvrA, partial [Clostridia bacterium]|nr:excinuclease ABC subunit UvrA [Clostridia bacterium]
MPSELKLKGVRVHNLKNIDITIPRDKLVVLTGLSGSGKSSLAFDTIYAEGHRRFVESLSSYARMFLGQLDKPDIDSIEGLSPAISIDQKTTSKNPRSTVGTVTEIYDYLRLLYARIGVPHCPVCGKEIRQQSKDQIVDRILAMPEGTRFLVLAPVVRAKKGMHEKVFADARKSGYVRVRVDGNMYELSEELKLDKNIKHTIEVVVDRLVLRGDIRARLGDSVETALSLADGNLLIAPVAREGETAPEELAFSQNYACEEHGISFGELEPRMFSFNNPQGACPHCAGLGEMRRIAVYKLIPDDSLSLSKGAIAVNGFKSLTADDGWNGPLFAAVGEKHGFTMDMPVKDFTKEQMQILYYGTGDEKYHIVRYFGGEAHEQIVPFEGLVPIIEKRMNMNVIGEYYDEFIEDAPCPECGGKRLSKTVLAVTVGGKNIDDFCNLSVREALDFVNGLTLTPTEETIAKEILKEVRARLGFLISVGLDYLTLARRAGTLSGGEAQRIRLATQIGSSLMGVLYILDEPSIGLHQRDNIKLIRTLQRLRDLGNSVLVVEHDEETMEAADFIVDIGPGAGVHGGEVVAAGTPQEIMANEKSLTGAYLSGKLRIPVPTERRSGNGHFLRVKGARQNNLKGINVDIPLGTLTAVTGVSGSGKSSLVNGILYPYLARKLNRAAAFAGPHDGIEGIEYLDKVIDIDQSPIGRTPRSNPATYTGLFNEIRDLFAKTPEARARGYTGGRFSFNVKGGRCEACEGDGVKKIEMHF